MPECSEAENGFMAKLCEYSVPQDIIPPNASLLAVSASTGLVAVASSFKGQHSIILLKGFAAAMPGGVKPGSTPLADVDHIRASLPAACFWVGWSHDESMVAAACVSGDIVVFGAQQTAMGNIQPLSHFHFPNPRQIAWAGDSRMLYLINRSHELSVHSLAHAQAATQLQANVTAVAVHGSFVAVANGCNLMIYRQTDSNLQMLLHHPISIPVDDGPAIIDGMAYISADTLILEV